MKFQEGDRVKIKKNIRAMSVSFNPGVSNEMQKEEGKTKVIEKKLKYGPLYYLEGLVTQWHEDWLEPVPKAFIINRPHPKLGSAILERGEDLGYTPSEGLKHHSTESSFQNKFVFFDDIDNAHRFDMGFYSSNLKIRYFPNPLQVSLDDFFSSDEYSKENFFGTTEPVAPSIGDQPVIYYPKKDTSEIIIFDEPVRTANVLNMRDDMEKIANTWGYSPVLQIGCGVEVTLEDLNNVVDYIRDMRKEYYNG